jgi:hypothetical protein
MDGKKDQTVGRGSVMSGPAGPDKRRSISFSLSIDTKARAAERTRAEPSRRHGYGTTEGVPDVSSRDGCRPVEIWIVWVLRSSSSRISCLEGSPPFWTSIRYSVWP